MLFEYSVNSKGNYALGLGVTYNHDGKEVTVQAEAIFLNITIGYNWSK